MTALLIRGQHLSSPLLSIYRIVAASGTTASRGATTAPATRICTNASLANTARDPTTAHPPPERAYHISSPKGAATPSISVLKIWYQRSTVATGEAYAERQPIPRRKAPPAVNTPPNRCARPTRGEATAQHRQRSRRAARCAHASTATARSTATSRVWRDHQNGGDCSYRLFWRDGEQPPAGCAPGRRPKKVEWFQGSPAGPPSARAWAVGHVDTAAATCRGAIRQADTASAASRRWEAATGASRQHRCNGCCGRSNSSRGGLGGISPDDRGVGKRPGRLGRKRARF